jgi:hypothetical protein
LQGDHKGALEELLPALDMEPGRHVDWGICATTHVSLLTLAGHADEAARRGLTCMEICRAERLSPTLRSMSRATADALIAAGRLPEARVIASELVDDCEREGIHGVNLALAYETLATVGMMQNDRALFEHAAARCNRESKRYPSLRARFERLLREAVQRGVREASPIHATDQENDRNLRELQTRLAGCLDRNERAHAVLFALVNAMHAQGGYLFGMQSGVLGVIAHCESVHGETASRGTAHNTALWPQPSERIRSLAESTLLDALETSSAATLSAAALHTLQTGGPVPVNDSLAAFALGNSQGVERAVAAVAVIITESKPASGSQPPSEPCSQPANALLELLGSTLLDRDDVDPVTRVA